MAGGASEIAALVLLAGLMVYRRVRGFTPAGFIGCVVISVLLCLAGVSNLLASAVAFPLAVTAVVLGCQRYPVMTGGLVMVSAATILEEVIHGSNATVYVLVTMAALLFARTTSEQKERLRKEVLFSQADAAAAERERTMQNLHDGLGHDLTVLLLNQQILTRAYEQHDAQRVQEALEDSTQLLSEANQRLRQFVHGKEFVSLKQELSAAVRELTMAGLSVNVVPTGVPEFPPEQDQALGWVLREAVTNVMRHAHATQVTFDLRMDDQIGVLVVRDNGIGAHRSSLPSAPAASDAAGGRGLSGMRSRLDGVGGQVSFATGPRGSTVTAQVPLVVSREKVVA